MKSSTVTHLRTLLTEAQAELAALRTQKPPPAAPSTAHISQAEITLFHLQTALKAPGTTPINRSELEGLAYSIADSWPFGSPLGEKILKIVQLVRELPSNLSAPAPVPRAAVLPEILAILSWTAVVVGIIMTAYALFTGWQLEQFQKRGVRTTAQVTSSDATTRAAPRPLTQYSFELSFTSAAGETVTATADQFISAHLWETLRNESTAEVMYFPEEPQRVILVESLNPVYFPPVQKTEIGLITLAAGTGGLVLFRKLTKNGTHSQVYR